MSSSADSQTQLLSMLLGGATAAELATTDADPAARDLAVRLCVAFTSGRRREQQLEALVETASELASLTDPSVVLDAIVRRARVLLGTDVAYLTLFDPERGDTFMRATAGSVSGAFQTLRLAFGAGLGGLVAQTRAPYWTEDYPADSRFHHTTPIDSAVGDEGIVAICGTPLLVKDEFVGVLFASNRTRRAYSHEDVALLGSLATLAAVTIVQVRALEESGRTLAALSAATEQLQQHATDVERAAAAHDRFAEIVLEGGGLDDLTGALASILGGWCVLFDDAGEVRSRAGADMPDDVELARVHDAASQAAPGGRVCATRDGWSIGVSALGEPVGTLTVGGTGPPGGSDERTIERAAVVTALVLLSERSRADAHRGQRSELVADLVLGRGDSAALVTAARGFGLDLRRPACVLVVDHPPELSDRALHLSVSAVTEGRGLAGVVDGQVVVVAAGSDPSALAADLADRLSRRGKGLVVTVGGAGPVTVTSPPLTDDIVRAHTEARRTAQALSALGHRGAGRSATDLGFAGLIVGTQPEVAAYVSGALGPLLDYDDVRGTALVDTLEAYFSSGSSPRHAASTLHVHPNTVAQRLDRITQLIGAGWQQPDRALELQLSLRLRRLVAADAISGRPS